MKRIIMQDRYNHLISITKTIGNDCFINETLCRGSGLFDVVNDYKKLGYKIIGIVKGIVFYYGDTCDLNNLTSSNSIWEVNANKRG